MTLEEAVNQRRAEVQGETDALLVMALSLRQRLDACREAAKERARRKAEEERRRRRQSGDIGLALAMIVDPLDWLLDLTYSAGQGRRPGESEKEARRRRQILYSFYGFWNPLDDEEEDD